MVVEILMVFVVMQAMSVEGGMQAHVVLRRLLQRCR
jgi:hypothetical protein